jgi:hypothetical protein
MKGLYNYQVSLSSYSIEICILMTNGERNTPAAPMEKGKAMIL